MPLPSIVVLDGFTLNPGDISWAPLQRVGAVTVHERTAASDVVDRLRAAEIALTNKVQLGPQILEQLPRLRYVGILATGTNAVDLAAARALNLVVSNVPAYSTESVVQLVFENLLDAVTQANAHRAAVNAGHWQTCPDFCFNVTTLRELCGTTLGIIGLGAIGSRVAQVAAAFGMRVLALQSPRGQHQAPAAAFPRVPLATLLKEADFLTLHCPLTEQTRGLIGPTELASMKPGAFLINTARGALVDEAALAQALDDARIAGAYLDVLSTEPPDPGHALLCHPRCKVTPHIAWTTREARERLLEVTAHNIDCFLRGAPQNVVS